MSPATRPMPPATGPTPARAPFEALFTRLSAELRPERLRILRRDELAKVVDAAVQAYFVRHGIEADPTARRDLITALVKALADAGSSRRVRKRPELPVRRPLKRPPIHPGALMREILEDHVKLTVAEAARRMKVSRPALYAVLNGSAAVTADMALRFARLTGGAPELYLNMQIGHDLEAAQQRLKDELASIESAAVA
jgi:addiction module HigA family antidote